MHGPLGSDVSNVFEAIFYHAIIRTRHTTTSKGTTYSKGEN